MSDITREQAKWAKERTKVVFAYDTQRDKLSSAVAAKGFTSVPGFLYELHTRLELDTKFKLSDINYEIIADTVERELKQCGIEYDLLFKQATIDWEIQKQEYLAGWDVEFARIKENMAGDEEALNIAEIELKVQEEIIIQRKTEIELLIEGLRKDMAALDGQTATYEVTLAQQKLLTATARLGVIPILQQIVSKQQELIVAERGKIGMEQGLIAKLNEVAFKKQNLIPVIANLCNSLDALKVALLGQKGQLTLLAAEKLKYAMAKVATMGWKLATARTMAKIEAWELEVQELKLSIEMARMGGETNAATVEALHMINVSGQLATDMAGMKLADESTMSDVFYKKELDANTEKDNKITNQNARGLSDVAKAEGIAAANKYRVEETANISALTSVTATLSHLLSM